MYIYDRAGPEPRLSDMLADPVVRAVMARDNVSNDHLLTVVTEARRRLEANDVEAQDGATVFHLPRSGESLQPGLDGYKSASFCWGMKCA